MTAEPALSLYSYWRSSASWRVRIVLGLKAVPYAYVPVHLVRGGGEQRGAAHLTRNPMGQVPTLEWEEGGQVRRLSQSVAIAEYLEARFPEPRLLPADAYQAALVRELVQIVNAGTQPLQNLSVTEHLRAVAAGADADAWNRHWIGRGLAALEARAQDTAGEFLVGDALSLADVFLVPQLYNARRFAVDLGAFPRLTAVEARVTALDAFARAHPDVQPDAPTSAPPLAGGPKT